MAIIRHQGEKVRNKVEWINPLFKRLPFRLKVGEESPLGIFSTPDSKGLRLEAPESKLLTYQEVTVSRSTHLAQPVAFMDELGNAYQRVNLKGGGLLEEGGVRHYPQWNIALGVVDEKNLQDYRNASQELLNAGVRVTPDIAHIRLYNYPARPKSALGRLKARLSGRKTVQAEFPDTKMRVLVLRAFGSIGRLENADDPALVEEAIQLVKREFGLKRLEKREYAEWVAKTVAENLAKLHSRGLVHTNFTSHNITLDARITDLGTVRGTRTNPYVLSPRWLEYDLEHADPVGRVLWEIADNEARYSFEIRRKADIDAGINSLKELSALAYYGNLCEIFKSTYNKEIRDKRLESIRLNWAVGK